MLRVPAQISVTLRWEGPDQVLEQQGVVEDVSEHGFSVLAHDDLPTGQTVWMTGRSVAGRKAIVRHSRHTEGGWVIGLRAVSREKRRIDRQVAQGCGWLRFAGPKGSTVSSEATVMNVSDGGMQLLTGVEAPPDTFIRLTGQALECEGSVRYCREDGASYVLGVQFVKDPSIKAPADASNY